MTAPSPPPRRRATRFDRHRGKVFLGFLLVALLGAEVATRVLAHRGLAPYTRHPTTREPRFWADVDETFGVWHLPHAEFRHGGPCFDVTYRSNSYGARDVERTRASSAPRRVVALGDSFVEGFGVERDARMTTLVEGATDVEMLNFGVSGNFGPVQQWLQYTSLASTFDHTDVFVFFLPANDFADMEPTNFAPGRYRPYLRETDGGYEVWYPVAFADRDLPAPQSWFKISRRHVYNNCYLLNALRQAFEPDPKTALDPPGPCSYRPRSRRKVARLLYAYERLVDAAAGRPVTIFVLPRLRDLEQCPGGLEPGHIVERLEAFAGAHAGVTIVDLLPHFVRDAETHRRAYDDYYLPCDGHWSELGNRVAAEAVVQRAFASRVSAERGPAPPRAEMP